MTYPKSTVQEIKERFDRDVERFSNLESGQRAAVDSAVTLDLITEAARRLVPGAQRLLDIGSGAGNYTLKMLTRLPGLHCTLVDLSGPMLERAGERLSAQDTGGVELVQGDFRETDLPANSFDIILAGAVLHHLRDDADWEHTFRKIHTILKPGGCFMVSDLVAHDHVVIEEFLRERYGDYLEDLEDQNYREHVLAYIAKEDTPRSVSYQLELMKQVGFRQTDILHKNMCFAAFGAIK